MKLRQAIKEAASDMFCFHMTLKGIRWLTVELVLCTLIYISSGMLFVIILAGLVGILAQDFSFLREGVYTLLLIPASGTVSVTSLFLLKVVEKLK